MSRSMLWKAIMLLALASLVVGACGQPTAQVITKVETVVVEKEVPVEKRVVETVVVEREKIVEKQVAQTVVVEKEVEKVVKETVVVEKEKVVRETVIVEKEVAPPEQMSDVQELRVYAAFWGGDVANLDPVRRGTWGFNHLMWVMLVAGDTAGNVIPEKSLAESWDVSEDGKVYTFKLRKDAKFSDGTPILADHVVGSLGYMAMMNHNEARGFRGNFGTGRRLYWDIVGMMDVPAQATYDQFGVLELPGVRKIDDFTVEIELTKPNISFIPRLTVAAGVFDPADLEKARQVEYDIMDYWPSGAVSSGMYKISEIVPGDRYTLVPNEYWFGPEPIIKRITVFRVADDINTVMTAFANKELDILATQLSGDSALQAFADPYMASTMLEVPPWQVVQFWVTPNEPLDDVFVRRAFSMAINKDVLVAIGNAGSDVELYRRVNMHRNPAVPQCEAETAEVQALPFDPVKAKEELQKSAYGPGVVDMEIHIYSSSAANLPYCEAIQAMLQENLGLKKVTVHTERIPNMMDPPYPLHLWYNGQMPWHPDVSDTLINMAQYVKDAPWSSGDPRAYIDVAYEPELLALVQQAMDEQDAAEKCQLIKQAGQLWNDHVFSLDWGVPVGYFLMAPWVENIEWYSNAGQGKPLNMEEVWVSKH